MPPKSYCPPAPKGRDGPHLPPIPREGPPRPYCPPAVGPDHPIRGPSVPVAPPRPCPSGNPAA